MTQGSNSAGIEPIVARAEHYNALAKALRLFVGRGRRFTYKQVQRGAGIPERMIEAFRYDFSHEDWRPASPEQFASLVYFLRADFLSEYLDNIKSGQAAYDLPDENAPPPGEIAAASAEDTANLTRMATSGEYIEHKPQLKVMGTRMMSRGANLVKLAMAA